MSLFQVDLLQIVVRQRKNPQKRMSGNPDFKILSQGVKGFFNEFNF